MKRSLSDSSSDEDQPFSSFQNKKMAVKMQPSSSLSGLSSYNMASQNMMQKMGYQLGEGLGKHGQGRTEIVETSKQRGRRGLGLVVPGFESTEEIHWNSEEEVIAVEEEVSWLPECEEDPPVMSDLRKMTREGPKKMNIDDELHFCGESYLKKVLSGKSVFDHLEPEEMRKARTRSNPFETIRGVIFQNRAAMKMANMDYVFDFMFTNPVDQAGNSLIQPNELLYFADVCAGPGGFSEYILWRKKWDSKGFGFTLRGQNDFKLDEFFAGPAEMFEPHYGKNGMEGDGDVFIPENAIEFKKYVMESTESKGVHFVMADGGFSVDGQENIQEILSKRLYLCQFMFALSILRTDGHFVCKLFDIFTPFSVGLVYLMYRTFKKVCIHKPNTSRPANSERYIICKWRRENTKDVHDYMFEVNCRLHQLNLSKSIEDVTEVVPLEMLKQDEKFCEYITNSNEILAKRQIVNLAKIQAFAQNTDLYEKSQGEMREQSLIAWDIPDQVRSAPKRPDVMKTYAELMNNQNEDLTYLTYNPNELTEYTLESISSIYEYKCMVSSTDRDNKTDRGFIFGLGRHNVMKGDGTNKSKWRKLDLKVELPKNTVLYVEIVNELQGEGRAQRKVKAVHVFDALFLGGKDVRHLDFVKRLAQAEKLAKAVSKPSRRDYSPIRVKELYDLKDLDLVFERLDMRYVKSSGGMQRLCYTKSENRYFLPSGIYFIRIIRDPWVIARSKRTGHFYYFNTKTSKSDFQFPEQAIANFKLCFSKRIFWAWEPGVKILEHHQADANKVHKSTICDFIERKSS